MPYNPNDVQKCTKEGAEVADKLRDAVGLGYFANISYTSAQQPWHTAFAARATQECLAEKKPRISDAIAQCAKEVEQFLRDVRAKSLGIGGLTMNGVNAAQDTLDYNDSLIQLNLNQCLAGTTPRLKDAYKR